MASELESLKEINKDTIKAALKAAMVKSGVKGKNFFMPIRLKLTGMQHGVEMFNIIIFLGIHESIRRLRSK